MRGCYLAQRLEPRSIVCALVPIISVTKKKKQLKNALAEGPDGMVFFSKTSLPNREKLRSLLEDRSHVPSR